MRSYEATTKISAAADDVWRVLVDVGRYTEWDSGVVDVAGTVAIGNKLKITSAVNPNRAFAAKVTALHPPAVDRAGRMVWRGGIPLGLFTGERTFTVTPGSTGMSTTVHVREEFSGPLLGMIWRSMPDLQPSFDQFVAGLRAHVEAQRGSS